MLIFKIIYYCYFNFFDLIVLGQINRAFTVKLLSVALMSMLSTALLVLLIHYSADLKNNRDITYGISIFFILLYYIVLAHNESHIKTIARVRKMHSVWRVLSFLVIYSLTIFILIVYFSLPAVGSIPKK